MQTTTRLGAPLLCWHGKPLCGCAIIVLAGQTTARCADCCDALRRYRTDTAYHCTECCAVLRRCCTGTANHCAAAPLLYWHGKPLHGCAVVVLAWQTTAGCTNCCAAMRRCCTGTATHTPAGDTADCFPIFFAMSTNSL